MMHQQFLGNPIEKYIWFIGILCVGFLFRAIISKWISQGVYRILKNYSKGEVGFDNLLSLLKKPVSATIFLLTLYLAFSQLNFPANWQIAPIETFGLRLFLSKTIKVAFCASFTWIILRLIDFMGLVLLQRASQTGSKSDDQIVPFIRESLKVVVVIFAIFFVLGAVFKLNITSLIAGLGIGGLAIALAAKESIENLLGSFTIFLDKPFVVGDLIKVGNIEGNVERIGFRSTRIRTLDKTFVTVPNKKLIDSELDNLSLRELRRVKFDLGIKYSSQKEKIETIILRIKETIIKHKDTTEESFVYLYAFKDYSISIRVIFFISTADWQIYMEVREFINYQIMLILEEEGCEFAFLTTTLDLSNSSESKPEILSS